MRYLCNSRPEVPEYLYPKEDLVRRAFIDQYLDWHHSGLRACTTKLVFKKYFAKLRKLDDAVDAINEKNVQLTE